MTIREDTKRAWSNMMKSDDTIAFAAILMATINFEALYHMAEAGGAIERIKGTLDNEPSGQGGNDGR